MTDLQLDRFGTICLKTWEWYPSIYSLTIKLILWCNITCRRGIKYWCAEWASRYLADHVQSLWQPEVNKHILTTGGWRCKVLLSHHLCCKHPPRGVWNSQSWRLTPSQQESCACESILWFRAQTASQVATEEKYKQVLTTPIASRCAARL